jgi:hypothetical protein
MPHRRKKPIPVHEVEVASIEEMNERRYTGHHTICETLREIYRETENEEVKLKIRLAMNMGKAMLAQLHYYKNTYEPAKGKHVLT